MIKNRLEAFSDGVLAIIITIMVLEMKVPHGGNWSDLFSIWPTFLSYILSFLYLGIYWNNHHHLIHAVKKSTGGIMWSNLHLLFWLSLIPFVTGWMGENSFAQSTVTVYGVVLLMCAIAFFILEKVCINAEGPDSLLLKAVGKDWKGKTSLLMYGLGIATSYFMPVISLVIYLFVAIIWLVPDKRIEQVLAAEE